MKKILFFAALLGLGLVGCKTDDTTRNIYTQTTTNPSVTSMDGSDSFVVSALTIDTVLTVKSNIWWLASTGGAPWVKDWGFEGIQMGFTKLHLTLEPNLGTDDRAFAFTFTADGDLDFSTGISVVQKTASAFAVSYDLADFIDPDRQAVIMPVFLETLNIHVTSNTDWVVVSDQPWCAATAETASGGHMADQPLDIVCQTNQTGAKRNATVSLKQGGADGATLLTIPIIQAEDFVAPQLTLTNDDTRLLASWSGVDGARGYEVFIADGNGTELTSKTLPVSTTSFDMTDFAGATGLATYVGPIEVMVRALTSDPTLFKDSYMEVGNSHFASAMADGSGDSQRFIIVNARHLANMAKSSAIGFYFYKFAFPGAQIDYAGQPFAAIFSSAAPFKGDLDGDGTVIKNSSLTVASSTAADQNAVMEYAFINAVANDGSNISRVANLTFSGCSFTTPFKGTPSGRTVAFCVAVNNGGVVSNIKLDKCKIGMPEDNSSNLGATIVVYYGGVVARNLTAGSVGGLVTGCTTSNGSVGYDARSSVSSPAHSTNNIFSGAIAANSVTGATIENCANLSTEVRGAYSGGGIVALNDGTVRGCVNNAAVSASVRAGGMAGGCTGADATSHVVMENCYNTGAISYISGTTASMIGGLIGGMNSTGTVTVRNCFNTGSLTLVSDNTEGNVANRAHQLGGLFGQLGTATLGTASQVTDCYNTGTVTININTAGSALPSPSPAQVAGGLVGGVYGPTSGSSTNFVANCYTSGRVTVSATGWGLNRVGAVAGNRQNAAGAFAITNVVFLENNVSVDGTANNNGVGPGSNQYITTGVVSATAAQMAMQGFFTGLGSSTWNFSTAWTMGGSNGYPILQALPTEVQ